MGIKQMMIEALERTKWTVPRSVDEKKWYKACDKAIEFVLKGKIQKVIEDYTDELKAELKELGVDYD